jgi:hypothetical protein
MGAYSKLHNYTAKKLRDNLPDLRIMENYHPDWLLSPIGTRLELDIFLPEINTAIEIQGAQHFSFTSFFHKSYSDFEKQKEYDEEKRNLCYGAGIKLIEVCTEKDADIFIEKIYSLRAKELSEESIFAREEMGKIKISIESKLSLLDNLDTLTIREIRAAYVHLKGYRNTVMQNMRFFGDEFLSELASKERALRQRIKQPLQDDLRLCRYCRKAKGKKTRNKKFTELELIEHVKNKHKNIIFGF